jgi:IS5 family transposase
MLRMVVAQQCLGRSDEGIEGAVYNGQAIRRFVGSDLARVAAPDATTLPKVRRPREGEGLTGVNLETIDAHLARQGLPLRDGALVDATLIGAPPSTPLATPPSNNNRGRARGPAMHQARKGNQR